MIDVQKVQEARRTIREAVKELRIEVKKYLEENRVLTFDVEPEDMKLSLVNIYQVKQITLENNLKVMIGFKCKDYFNWEYNITCEQLEIYHFEPARTSDLSAQGELTFKYVSPEGTEERKITLQKYSQD